VLWLSEVILASLAKGDFMLKEFLTALALECIFMKHGREIVMEFVTVSYLKEMHEMGLAVIHGSMPSSESLH
jgi:hypothetical protein